MKIKPGVRIAGASPELNIGLQVAQSVYEAHGQDLTITSISEGRHMPGSLHHCGRAADLRLPERDLTDVSVELGKALGDEWDIVTEDDHIHMEYDPGG